MSLIKLAAAGAAAYGVYRLIAQQRGARTAPQAAGAATGHMQDSSVQPGAPTTSPDMPVGLGSSFVAPT